MGEAYGDAGGGGKSGAPDKGKGNLRRHGDLRDQGDTLINALVAGVCDTVDRHRQIACSGPVGQQQGAGRRRIGRAGQGQVTRNGFVGRIVDNARQRIIGAGRGTCNGDLAKIAGRIP